MTPSRELPSGTVTFLFTDVEGSTRLLHELGAERYGQALREHRRALRKDLTAPEPLYQLGDGQFPPLKSLNQSNLPDQPTPFVGRDQELADVVARLRRDEVRLLTLTGPGGSGKTRLAVQAAAELVEEYPHGVWWVGLQALRDPGLVVPSVAATLGAQDELSAHISDHAMLLVLDNLEQVVDAAPALAALLAACPRLKLLCTSREPLRVAAEQEHPVPPFVEQDAVAFFLARAQAVRPDFSGNGTVRLICSRLDHLPLALELAAARTRSLSPEQILERLELRLPLLTGGARDVPERQRTLRSTIAWSHELLSPEEQRLLRRLSVFAGGCTLESAEDVCDADVDTLESLVDKSLLRFGDGRYTMLETIREYASERLEQSSEDAATSRRHAEWALAFAQTANLAVESEGPPQYEDAIAEAENLSAAVEWARDADPELGLRLAVALMHFWVPGNPFEGARRLEALLERASDASPKLRARALRDLGGALDPIGEHERAEHAYRESLELFQEMGDEPGAAHMVFRLGASAANLGDTARARPLLEEGLERLRALGDRRGAGLALGCLGIVAQLEGGLAAAAPLLAESADIAEETGFVWWQSLMLTGHAEVSLELGNLGEAEAGAREAVSLSGRIGNRQGLLYGLALMARLAAERGDEARAGRMWGAIEAEEARGPVGGWERQRDELAAPVLARAGPEFERARADGRGWSLDDAVSAALALDYESPKAASN